MSTQNTNPGVIIGSVVGFLLVCIVVGVILALTVFKKPSITPTPSSSTSGTTSGNLSGTGGTSAVQVPVTPSTSSAPVIPQIPLRTKITNTAGALSNEFHGNKQSTIKKVQLELPTTSVEPINLGEVKFLNGSTPVVVPASSIYMSTVHAPESYGPGKFVDGDIGTFGHTKNLADSISDNMRLKGLPIGAGALKEYSRRYITFTFDSPTVLTEIQIYNRQDCCQSRINGLVVTLFDSNNNILADSDSIVWNNSSRPPSPFLYKYVLDK